MGRHNRPYILKDGGNVKMAKDLKQFLEKCDIVALVYATDNYEVFSELEYNRDVSENRVNKLLASFSEKEILNPITCNEKLEIVDGQGRFEVLKKLKRPVKFLIEDGATFDDCKRMNLYNTSWKTEDFVRSYISAGNKNYINLQQIREETKLSYATILRLINKGTHREKKADVLQNGEAIFTNEDMERVRQLFKKITEIKDALTIVGKLNENFIVGLKIVTEHPLYSHARMLKKCVQTRHNFAQMTHMEPMLKEFSRVYNFGTQKESNKLHFEDYMRNKGYSVRSYVNNGNLVNDVSPSAKTLRRKK